MKISSDNEDEGFVTETVAHHSFVRNRARLNPSGSFQSDVLCWNLSHVICDPRSEVASDASAVVLPMSWSRPKRARSPSSPMLARL
jgi:hypothetical protein